MPIIFPFNEGHVTCVGLTQSGKTYATAEQLSQLKEGVLYFNTTHTDSVSRDFIECDRNTTFKMIEKALKAGEKINFLPTKDPDIRELELELLIRKLYLSGYTKQRRIYLAVDECHLYGGQALKSCIEVATTGLSNGIFAVWISQRPAKIDNTLMTQSNAMVIFKMNMESNYFNNYKIPYDEIQKRIDEKGQYSFCLWDWREVKGAFRV